MKKGMIFTLLVVSMLLLASQATPVPAFERAEYNSVSTLHDEHSYLKRTNNVNPDNMYVLSETNFVPQESSGYEIYENYEGVQKAVFGDDTSTLTYAFHNDEAGDYNIKIRYYPIEGKSGNIERTIKINDVVPFDMANQIILKRIWKNETNDFLQDLNGNDILPKQIEAPRWVETTIKDSNGYIDGYLEFTFDEGLNTISFEAIREPIVIETVTIYQAKQLPTYDEYVADLSSDIDITSNQEIVMQGEAMHEKTSPTLYPIVDRTSPLTVPQHHAKLKLNAGGGINYRMVGDWISYEFEVEEAGLYNISMRYKQTFLRGAYVTREIRIDGEVPFEEMRKVEYQYSNWDSMTFGDDEPFLFYLEEGTHTISFEVVLGNFTDSIRRVEGVIDQLNDLYRRIIMITSTTPDVYRDYQLTDRLPTMLDTFQAELDTLNSVIDNLYEVTKENSDKTVALNQVAIQLEGFLERPQTIHQRLGEFRNNVSALGTWILNIKEQPITIDYITVHSADVELPQANANFFQTLWFELKSFFASFFVDYNALSSSGVEGEGETIKVWIGSGRDQANIVRRLIDESFTPDTGVNVQLELVNPAVLLPATFTGKGPDVMMGAGNTTPVNYAMRNAVADLTQFSDFDQVMTAYKQSAITPYEYEGGVYALPEQQIFPVMFYRKDIMTEIGIFPNDIDDDYFEDFTWDDVIDMIPELQRLNLEFYLPIDIIEQQLGGIIPPNLVYVSMLYQNGGQLYSDDSQRTLLQETTAVETFKTWSDFYTNYRFSIQANFVNRFRTGEMPIGIAYYNTYNVLSVFAPEITGDWTFTMIPGTKQDDGSIDHATVSTGTGSIILKQSDKKQAAWEFLKWWGSEDVQVKFGREMEGIMGAAARYPTANVAALEKLPWPSSDIETLLNQWDEVQGIPEIPGSYITGRYMDNALRRVINTGANPRETLYEYAELINDEITNKRKEFGLD